jgi:hypothetical protein
MEERMQAEPLWANWGGDGEGEEAAPRGDWPTEGPGGEVRQTWPFSANNPATAAADGPAADGAAAVAAEERQQAVESESAGGGSGGGAGSGGGSTGGGGSSASYDSPPPALVATSSSPGALRPYELASNLSAIFECRSRWGGECPGVKIRRILPRLFLD